MTAAVSRQENLRPDLRFWLEDWINTQRSDVSEARRKADTTRVARYIVPHLGRRSVRNLSSGDIAEWIETLQAEGIGDPTIHASLLALRGALNHAQDRGLISVNPAKGVSVPTLQVIRSPEKKEILSEAQLKRLLRRIDPWYRSLVLLAARTGAKWDEAVGLRAQDVYVDHGVLNLGHTRAVEDGGRIKYTEGRPSEVRLVEMTPDLVEEMAKTIEETSEFRSDNWPWVFMTKRDHKHPLRPNFNTFVLKPALEAANLDPDLITYHSLRHTAAVRMIREGEPVETISKALGHKSVTTTKRIYADYLREAAAK